MICLAQTIRIVQGPTYSVYSALHLCHSGVNTSMVVKTYDVCWGSYNIPSPQVGQAISPAYSSGSVSTMNGLSQPYHSGSQGNQPCIPASFPQYHSWNLPRLSFRPKLWDTIWDGKPGYEATR